MPVAPSSDSKERTIYVLVGSARAMGDWCWQNGLSRNNRDVKMIIPGRSLPSLLAGHPLPGVKYEVHRLFYERAQVHPEWFDELDYWIERLKGR